MTSIQHVSFFYQLVSPSEKSREEPHESADERGPRLGAHVPGAQRLADRVVALEADRQDREHRRVRHRQLHERDCQAWGGKEFVVIRNFINQSS